MRLKQLREKIDKIDKKILGFLNERAVAAVRINELKKKDDIVVYSAEREAAILNRLKYINKGLLTKENVDLIFREIFSICRSLRANLRIAYLGPHGTYSHSAAIKNFGKSAEYVSCEDINDVFDKVERADADYGVVPVENSTGGAINHTLDIFFTSTLKICAEVTLGISHSLLAVKPGHAIKKIYSKPEVFSQCRLWLSENYPKVELVPVSSTAKAAIAVKNDCRAACIGNKVLADIYGLKVLASSIEDSSSNITRFLVLSKHDSLFSGNDKTSILFAVKDKPGALYNVLFLFKKYGINLTKIESRPSRKKPWEYYFFVDFEGHKESPHFKKVLKELEKRCIFVKILGSYPRES